METEAGADNLHYIKDMVDRACELFRGNKMEEFDAQINEVRNEVSRVIVLHDERWKGLRRRICPLCATVIPTCFCCAWSVRRNRKILHPRQFR